MNEYEVNERTNPATNEPGPAQPLARLTARMRPLDVDQLLLAEHPEDPALARDWAAFLDAPRALLVEPVAPGEAGLLVVFNTLDGADERSAEEMLLEAILGGALRIFEVNEARRVSERRIEVPEPWDVRARVGTLAAARGAADLRACLAAHAEPGPPSENARLEMRGYGLLEPGVAAATRWIDRLVRRAAEAGAIRDDEIDVFSRALVRRERWLRRQARERFATMLDPEVVTNLRRDLGEIDLRLYEWLREAEGDAARNRRQALRAYPAAVAEVLYRDDDAEGLTAAIDGGLPLAPLLAFVLGVGRRAVGVLRGIRSPWLDGTSVEPVAQGLRRVSPAHRPRTRGEWRAFAALARAAWSIRTVFTGTPERMVRAEARLGSCFEACGRRGWRESRRRFEAGFRHTRSLRDFHDVVRSIRGRGLPPGIDRERVLDGLAGLSLIGLQRVSERWHAALALAPVERDSPRAELSWPALIDEFEHAGLAAVALTTPAALTEEGQHLRHCIGTFSERCLFERVHVVSLRDASGRSVSTAELAVERGKSGWKLRVEQHRGFRNGEPPQAARTALDVLLAQLATPDAQAQLNGLDAGLAERLGQREEIEARLDAGDPAAERHAFRETFGDRCGSL